MNRTTLYDEVTASIVAALEAGAAPWSASWTGNAAPLAMPLRHNGIEYKGINTLILWLTAQDRGYGAPRWLTFKQALELGGNVRKGEKGSKIVYYGAMERERDNAKTGDSETQRIPFLKSYAVFNAEQCEGLPSDFCPASIAPASDEAGRLADAETFFANIGAKRIEASNRAFYSPSADQITLPPFATFNTPAAFYSVQAHEHIHWTMTAGRCDRNTAKGNRFGDDAYAMEELVAELGAAFVCAQLGIVNETRDDHAAYLSAWLSVLKKDSRAIFTVAAAASKAANYLASLQPGGEEAPAAPAPAPAAIVAAPQAAPAAQLALF